MNTLQITIKLNSNDHTRKTKEKIYQRYGKAEK